MGRGTNPNVPAPRSPHFPAKRHFGSGISDSSDATSPQCRHSDGCESSTTMRDSAGQNAACPPYREISITIATVLAGVMAGPEQRLGSPRRILAPAGFQNHLPAPSRLRMPPPPTASPACAPAAHVAGTHSEPTLPSFSASRGSRGRPANPRARGSTGAATQILFTPLVDRRR